jgi:glycosyltransferase involved in cell wall biosynthesis
VRVAVWTPLPPQRGEIARHAHILLGSLARSADVVAVARDDVVEVADVPAGVEVVAASRYVPGEVDLDVYQMGNDAPSHGFAHTAALTRPGMLVLHDPALVDFYLRLAGGVDGSIFRAEAAFNCPEATPSFSGDAAGDATVLDPLQLLMSRRLVEASLLTVVHSSWAARELSRRSPRAKVVYAPRAIELARDLVTRAGRDAVVFGAVGGAADRHRLAKIVEAFGAVHREFDAIRLVIGAADVSHAEDAVRELVCDSGFAGAVTAVGRVCGQGGFFNVLSRCDVLVDLTWPTSGGTSALVLGALAAGRPVISSDAPQYRELDERICWRVATDPQTEQAELQARLRAAATDPAAVRMAGELAAQLVQPTVAPEVLAGTYGELVRTCAARTRVPTAARGPAVVTRPLVGVNAIASWEATTGITEAARRCVGALVDAGVDVSLEDYDFGAPQDPHRLPVRLRVLPKGRAHDLDLCFLNVNELTLVPDTYLHPPGKPRRIVAYWHWEQVSLPAELQAQLERVDEIWVSSRFTAATFQPYTSKRIAVVPCVVEPVADTSLRRVDFGLPDTSCLFFFHFDVNSTVARKNPRGVIEAYRRAFTPAERAQSVHLAMKTINLAHRPEAQAELQDAMDFVGGTILDVDLRNEEVAALTALCDVYVSLHRAEGFGLGLAEAMYFAKPVIGTAYSGNMDFMTVENSCPIGYRMAQIQLGDLRFNRWSEQVYRPGEWWAEPDLDDAARWMRRLYEDGGLRQRLGTSAARTIREKCNSRVLGDQMRELLQRGGAPS